MSTRYSHIIFSIMAAYLLCTTPPAVALDAPHDTLECNDCHFTHGASYPANIGLLCESCHFEGGPAPAAATHSSRTTDDDYGNWDLDCIACHDPHAQEQNNVWGTTYGMLLKVNLLAQIKQIDPLDPGPYYEALSILRTVTSSDVRHVSAADFVDGDASANDDICQVCHENTAYYNTGAEINYHDNMGSASQPGGKCTTCHPHDGGFQAAGGCTVCHAQQQQARRIVAGASGDFARASHHVTGAVQDSDCTLCHFVGDHKSGTVKLKDPDAGDSTVYDYDPANPAGIEDFCLNCHDADGAAAGSGTQPFSDNQTVPDIKNSGMWLASAHATGGVTNSGYTCFGDGVTTGCHGNGHGSNLANLLAPDNGTAGAENYYEEEGFCFNCHTEGGVVNENISNGWIEQSNPSPPPDFITLYEDYADDIEEVFNLHSGHPVADSDPEHVFNLGGGDLEMECTSCHNVHKVSGKYWQAPDGKTPVTFFGSGELWGDEASEKTAAYLPSLIYMAPFIGEPGLDLAGNALPIDGAGNSLLIDTVVPDYNSLCLECHQYAVGDVVAIDYTKKHGSAPAEPIWSDNGTLRTGFELAQPFDDNDRGNYFLQCIDCHDAHGSENAWLIRETANGELVSEEILESSEVNWRSICDRCHISAPAPRHHNDDVWYNKLGSNDCMQCHSGVSIYSTCITTGCHGHNDPYF